MLAQHCKNGIQMFRVYWDVIILTNHNFHPLEVVSRYRNPKLQVDERYSYLFRI